ncbi:hypothetical protein TB1_016140 [Malus domestica]
MQLKPFNSFSIAFMMSGTLLLVFFCSFLKFPFLSTSIKPINDPTKFTPDPFTNLIGVFRKWDAQVGCSRFREKHKLQMLQNKSSSLQQIRGESECGEAKSEHVSVLVKGWTWIPDNLDILSRDLNRDESLPNIPVFSLERSGDPCFKLWLMLALHHLYLELSGPLLRNRPHGLEMIAGVIGSSKSPIHRAPVPAEAALIKSISGSFQLSLQLGETTFLPIKLAPVVKK